MLTNIRIVLVNTSHPGNIGAVARAMKTMGLSQLYLVQPKSFPHPGAEAMAAGAHDLLTHAVITTSLEQALMDCQLVIGTSARARSLAWPQLSPAECAEHLLSTAKQGTVAVVFGSEKTGLTNQELQRCHYQVQIPSNPEYSSLNLAAAVQIICYEIYKISQINEGRYVMPEEWASADELELFYVHLEKVLKDLDFLTPKRSEPLMGRIRRLFNRKQLDKKELNILRGILTAMEKNIAGIQKSSPEY